jgi:bifunctional UDP-N-acetylglucosamine pyrophosphorylase / glucosamine-1-phosphate N-acetyltransferase
MTREPGSRALQLTHDCGHHETADEPSADETIVDERAAGESAGRRSALSVRPLFAVVLAAGQGTRMRSARPKPLHMLCGRPLVRYVLDAVAGTDIETARAVVVVGHGAETVIKALQEDPGPVPLEFVEQRVQRGTGDAVAVGLTGLPDDDLGLDADDGDVVVLPGDTPLVWPATIGALVREHRLSGAACTLLTARLDDPTGYGRVVRDKEGRVRRIVEHRDADGDELTIDEVNTSIYVFRRGLLAPALRRLTPENSQGELYVTDVIEVLAQAGHPVVSLVADDPIETQGVNDRAQLAAAEAELRRRTNAHWMREGVGMVDPDATYVDTTVVLARDVVLFPGTVLQGATVVGPGTEIGPATRLSDTRVGARAKVNETVATLAEIGDDAVVGPFAVLEPGARVGDGVRTGPFYTGGTG